MALSDHDKAIQIAESMTDSEVLDLVDSLLARAYLRGWVLVQSAEGDRWERRRKPLAY